MIEKLYIVPQIAEILNISEDATRDRIQAKKIKAVKVGRKYLVKESDLLAYINTIFSKVS